MTTIPLGWIEYHSCPLEVYNQGEFIRYTDMVIVFLKSFQISYRPRLPNSEQMGKTS